MSILSNNVAPASDKVLQDAATATTTDSTATAMPVGGLNGVMLQVTGTFSATITVKLAGAYSSSGSATYVAVPIVNVNTGALIPSSTGITSTGLYWVPCTGGDQLIASITTYTSGSVTIYAKGVAAGSPPVDVNAFQSTSTLGGVTQATSPWVDNITQIGGNTIATGTGVDGSGVQRVTLATDIKVPTVLATDVISATPTVSTSPAYTSGDAVGGVQTLASFWRTSGGNSRLNSLTIVDKGNQKPNLTLLFFNANPSAATITDNSAFAFSTDISKCVGKYNVSSSDFETVDSKAVACLKNIGLDLEGNSTTSCYVAVLTTSTPTFASTSDLIFYYGLSQS